MVTASEIKEYRVREGVSIVEAKYRLTREKNIQEADRLIDLLWSVGPEEDVVKDTLLFLLERYKDKT